MPRILVVDDDIPFRKMLRLTLAKMGHDLREARNGNEALAVLAEAPVDLVITDLLMPEKEGIETIGELRRDHPGVKVIAMSGGGHVSGSDYLPIAKAMGAHRVLAKPFSNAEMQAAIAAALDSRCATPGTRTGPSAASVAAAR